MKVVSPPVTGEIVAVLVRLGVYRFVISHGATQGQPFFYMTFACCVNVYG